MEKQIQDIPGSFITPQEWARLVRLCAVITNDREAAEDLAQETVLEAWRHKHELRDPEKQAQWLSGIARNVCLRWQRKRGRELAHSAVIYTPFVGQEIAVLEETLADDYDIEIELERKELIELLDRAMALLPQETRTVLVKRYVGESSLAEVAAQLGTNTSVVAMRLQRGKLALRRVLTKEMSQDISPYRVFTTDEWEETPFWCYYCGQHHLLGKRKASEGELLLKCPECSRGVEDLVSQNHLPVLQGLKSYKPLLSRLMIWCNNFYRTGLSNGTVPCEGCGRHLAVHIGPPPLYALQYLREKNELTLNIRCTSCNSTFTTPLESLVLSLPEARQFWQRYPRMRTLPRQYIEVEGCSAIVTCFESVTENAQLTIISAQNNYEVLHIYGAKANERR